MASVLLLQKVIDNWNPQPQQQNDSEDLCSNCSVALALQAVNYYQPATSNSRSLHGSLCATCDELWAEELQKNGIVRRPYIVPSAEAAHLERVERASQCLPANFANKVDLDLTSARPNSIALHTTHDNVNWLHVQALAKTKFRQPEQEALFLNNISTSHARLSLGSKDIISSRSRAWQLIDAGTAYGEFTLEDATNAVAARQTAALPESKQQRQRQRAAASQAADAEQMSNLLNGRHSDMRTKFPSEAPFQNEEASQEHIESHQQALRRGTLIFIGAPGTGTGFHCDITNAHNLALAADGSGQDVAHWLFIEATVSSIQTVSRYLQTTWHTHYPYGLGAAPFSNLDPTPMMKLPIVTLQHMEQLLSDSTTSQHVFRIIQQHGNIITVPPGYVHAVTNVAKHIKIAYDRLVLQDAAKTAMVRWTIAAPIFGQRMAADYASVASKCLQEWIRLTA